MFIRWQSRKRLLPAFGGWGRQLRSGAGLRYYAHTRKGTSKQDVCWKAILAESVRVDGRPTQRHIAYLGSITDSAIEIMAQRCFFWDHVTERLDRLGNQITVEDRQRIEAAVAKKVPRPTPDVAAARSRAEAVGWEWLSNIERAVLKDEADQLEGRDGRLTADAKGLIGAKPQRRCAFCGNNEKEAHTLVTGGAAFICDECVEAAAKLIAERKATPAA